MTVKTEELPRYFAGRGWRRVPSYMNVQRRDVIEPCALCGWGRDMAIHRKPEGAAPVGPLGLHGWVRRNTPNVEAHRL